MTLNDGRVLAKEKADYEGFHARPMPWETVAAKFESLGGARDVAEAVAHVDEIPVAELARLLERGGVNGKL